MTKKEKFEVTRRLAVQIYDKDNVFVTDRDNMGSPSKTIDIKFDKLIIRNSKGNTHEIRDIFASIAFTRWNIDGQKPKGDSTVLSLNGFRTSYDVLEAFNNYTHSHLSSSSTGRISTFCLGDSTSDFAKAYIQFQYAYNDESVEDEDFERKAYIMITYLKFYLEWESLEGVPYMKIANLRCTGHYRNKSYAIDRHANASSWHNTLVAKAYSILKEEGIFITLSGTNPYVRVKYSKGLERALTKYIDVPYQYVKDGMYYNREDIEEMLNINVTHDQYCPGTKLGKLNQIKIGDRMVDVMVEDYYKMRDKVESTDNDLIETLKTYEKRIPFAVREAAENYLSFLLTRELCEKTPGKTSHVREEAETFDIERGLLENLVPVTLCTEGP